MSARVDRLREAMASKGLDGLLVTKPENRLYLCGFSGSEGVLLVTEANCLLVVDGRYTEQALREAPQCQVVEARADLLSAAAARAGGVRRLGFESQHLTCEAHARLQAVLGERMQPCPGLVEGLRQVKDEGELELVRGALEAGERAFLRLQRWVREGVCERRVALEMSYLLRLQGCEREAFDTIAASGPNAALPHAQPGDRTLQAGDMLVLDFGGRFHHYCGDTTRTVAVGAAPPRLREVYARVAEAQQAAIERVAAGVPAARVDEAARGVLRAHGLAEYFVHSTGHGLGLEVHEAPSLGARSDEILAANMVVTIEPGVYLPGWGGVRIEDVVVVKDGGCEALSQAPRELLILGMEGDAG